MSTPDVESLTRLVVELTSRLDATEKKINEQQAEIIQLRTENAELRARLGMNSSNSSQPPSADGPAVGPTPRSLRRRSGRKPGGQSGHPGTTLTQIAEPDQVISHAPDVCHDCGRHLDATCDQDTIRRQVFDIPLPRVVVTEHHLTSRRCPCGKLTRAMAPPGVEAPTQYGPGIAAVGLYLYQAQFCSINRTAQALAELFGLPISVGTLTNWTSKAAADLDLFTDQVTTLLAHSALLHVDETSIKHPGGRLWIHSASNDQYSLLTAHPSRGRTAINAANVIPRFTGTLVHDAYTCYDTYPGVTRHVLCGAHLLRELQAVTDHHRATADPESWCWATQASDSLLRLHHASRNGPLDSKLLDTETSLIRTAAHLGSRQAGPGKLAQKHRALARRILNRLNDYLGFAHHPNLPFTNNPAEQEVRMVKLRAKISGCLRTLTGAQHFATLRSYLATTRKQHLPTLEALNALTSRNPWTPATT